MTLMSQGPTRLSPRAATECKYSYLSVSSKVDRTMAAGVPCKRAPWLQDSIQCGMLCEFSCMKL